MNKKPTPLQALVKIINAVDGYVYFAENLDKEYEIIKQKLERLEELEKAFVSLSKEDEKAKKLLSLEIEKNRAFEIIKIKRVDVQLLKDSKNLNDYNWCVHTKDRALTQEEYELLKEALK